MTSTAWAGINFGSSPVGEVKTRKELIEYMSDLRRMRIYNILSDESFKSLKELGRKHSVTIPLRKEKVTPTDDIYELNSEEEAIEYGSIAWRSPRAMNALRYKLELLQYEYTHLIAGKGSWESIYDDDVKPLTRKIRFYNLALDMAIFHKELSNDVGSVVVSSAVPVSMLGEE